MSRTKTTGCASAVDFWAEHYWLEHSEGFAVDSPAGRLGYVADVDPRRAELVVVGDLGATTIQFRDVDHLETAGERLILK